MRYEVTNPIDATVVSLTAPQRRPNGVFGWVVVSSLWAVTLGSDALVLQRRWRRVQEEAPRRCGVVQSTVQLDPERSSAATSPNPRLAWASVICSDI